MFTRNTETHIYILINAHARANTHRYTHTHTHTHTHTIRAKIDQLLATSWQGMSSADMQNLAAHVADLTGAGVVKTVVNILQ